MTDVVRDQPGARSACRTRTRILVAAADLFGLDGFHETSVRAIGAAATVDPALVSRYFGGKGELFAAALQRELKLALVGDGVLDREALGRFTRLLIASAFAPASVKTLCVKAISEIVTDCPHDCAHRWRAGLDEPATLTHALEVLHALHPGDPTEPLARALYALISGRSRQLS